MRRIFFISSILSVTVTILIYKSITYSTGKAYENSLVHELIKANEKSKQMYNQYVEFSWKVNKYYNVSEDTFLHSQRNKLKNVDEETWSNINDVNRMTIETAFLNKMSISLPYVYMYENTECLVPKNYCLHLNFYLGHERSNSTFVIGVPTVKRASTTYLFNTLESIISKSSASELMDVLIVVSIGETDTNYIISIANEIIERFPNEIDSGLIELISPMKSFYVKFDNLVETFNDKIERVRWRAKQVFDISFLMAYSYLKAPFYLQLEDDIIVKDNFLTKIKEFTVEKSAVNPDWFYLEFCHLGFIGKLFPSSKLIDLLLFFYIFYKDKPIDWLLMDYVEVKYCSIDNKKDCKKMIQNHVYKHRKSLFQHTGIESSLRGKIQKAKDKSFGKIKLNYGHENPDAQLFTNIEQYKSHSLKSLYMGSNFFWGLNPKTGDEIRFNFDIDGGISLGRFFFRSGHTENINDVILEKDAVIEVQCTNQTGYQFVGSFNKYGIASRNFTNYKMVTSLRIRFLLDLKHWVILSEVLVEENVI